MYSKQCSSKDILQIENNKMSVSYYIFALNIFAAKCIEIKERD